jgi:hypothetical protein
MVESFSRYGAIFVAGVCPGRFYRTLKKYDQGSINVRCCCLQGSNDEVSHRVCASELATLATFAALSLSHAAAWFEISD